MRFRALACDYDGTIAEAGEVAPATVAALQRVRESGRRLFLVTGREIDELQEVCPYLHLFDRVVAENGALYYDPATGHREHLGAAPPEEFVVRLRKREVYPLSVGKTIVATLQNHEAAVVETIQELGLELQVILNKGAVMILPAGMSKATGLAHALLQLGLSPRNAVAVGDAENDHALLASVEFGVALDNALPALKERADLVTSGGCGEGVCELIDHLIKDDLGSLEDQIARKRLLLGRDAEDQEIRVAAYGESLAFVATEKDGWPPAPKRFAKHLAESGYQFCALSVGGRPAVGAELELGRPDRPPKIEDALLGLQTPSTKVAIDLSGLPTEYAGAWIHDFLARIADMRHRVSRPHWILLNGWPSELAATLKLSDELKQGIAWIVRDIEDLPATVRGTVRHVVQATPHSCNGAETVVTMLGGAATVRHPENAT